MQRQPHPSTQPHGPKAPPASTRSFIGAYSMVKASTSVQAADPHQLVAMLFKGLQDALHEAKGALQRQDVALKCSALSRAARIVDEGLKASLNLKEGGEVAANLQTLYDYMSLTITKANLHQNVSLVDEVLNLVQPIQDAWSKIAPQGKVIN